MRYSTIDNIEFTNADNNVHVIKDRRPIPVYNILTTINKNKDALGDEIAVKREIYGPFSEDLTYRLYEANIEDLLEQRFDFSKLKQIKIPAIED